MRGRRENRKGRLLIAAREYPFYFCISLFKKSAAGLKPKSKCKDVDLKTIS